MELDKEMRMKELRGRDTLKATPRNKALGAASDVMKPLVRATDMYELDKRVPLIGGMTLADLGPKGMQSLLEDLSYGAPLVRNTRNIQTAQFDPRLLDLADMLGGAAGVGKAVGKRAIKEGMRRIEEGTLPGMIEPRMYAMEPGRPMKARAPKELAPLERAPAKTLEELEAIAQRVAPQITGEFVRGKTGSSNVLGMSKKRFDLEKELEHDIRPTGVPEELTMFDYPSNVGKVQVGVFGDPTIAGQSIHGVAGKELARPSPQFGGPEYNLFEPEDAWASHFGAASGLQNLAMDAARQYGDVPVVGMYTKMGPAAYGHAQHLSDALMMNIVRDLPNMSKAQIEAFNKLVRNNPAAESFAGIENPEIALAQMESNSAMRKQFHNLATLPTLTETLGMPNGLDVIHAGLVPELRNLETGISGHSVVELDPSIRELSPATHPTYDTRIPRKEGTGIMQTEVPIPYELQFADQLLDISKNPKQAPQPFGTLQMSGARQIIDPQLIEELGMYRDLIKKYTGKAEGGSINEEEMLTP